MRIPLLGAACLSVAIAATPVSSALAAQSGADVPKLPASSWKPEKPVELLVQSAAGGGSDIFARNMAKVLAEEKIVTVPINVVNKPGGSGAIAYSYLSRKKGDPYVVATATGGYITTPVLGHSPVSYKDFTNLMVLCVEDYVGVVRADSPYKSLKELIAAAKQKPNSIRVGGTGPGGSDAIIRTLVEKAAKVQLNFISFQSGGEVNAALLGGSVDFASPNPSEATQLVKAGRLRPLAMFSPQRLDNWKDVPTAREQGVDVTLDQFRGVVAASGLTKDQELFWQNAMVKLYQAPGFKKYMQDNGLRPLVKVGADFDKYLAEQTAFYTEIYSELGMLKKK